MVFQCVFHCLLEKIQKRFSVPSNPLSVFFPVRPQTKTSTRPGVAELEGLEVQGAVRRQAREVHLRVGQSGLPARRAASAAGHLGIEESLTAPAR